ncbi:MAG: ABC transporter ATP-binding protein [Clostridiales bacterium]|jgi:ABC-2 type transport system ATP-binding protein|nr:ABC transporter ATP-binding protein [Clostridiales bacterium]
MMDTEKISLEVKNLTKKWSDFTLHDINISLPEGYIMGLIGKNGSGKSTLINCILDGVKKSRGRVSINGVDHRRVNAKNDIGFILEDGPFFMDKTIAENAYLFGRFYSDWSESTFCNYIYQFELRDYMRYADLSKGMKTKFQLAFALSHKPRLLIMDEPTGGMDPVFRRDFLNILQGLVCDSNTAVLFSTHITADLDKVADFITMLDEGKQVFAMTKEELIDNYPIIRGRREDLSLIKEGCPMRVRKTSSGFETILENYNILSEDSSLWERFTKSRPNLEEIMYFFSEPLIQ